MLKDVTTQAARMMLHQAEVEKFVTALRDALPKVERFSTSLKVHMTRNFFISLFERAFKMMKNGVYFIVIALLVAELFKILVYAN